MGEGTAFRRALAERNGDPAARRWLFVPYDQLSDGIGPLSREAPEELGIVVVESASKPRRRPYHRQKLALVLANLRHFALEQAERGVAVRHVFGRGGYADALREVARELGPMRVMRPAERELRRELAPLLSDGTLVEVLHEGWLTTREEFDHVFEAGPPWRMDAFYRAVRQRTGVLMEDGLPQGGRYSFDGENRDPWPGEPPAPEPPVFSPDAVTQEVGDLVASRFDHHPGRLDLASLPATAKDAEKLWRWAKKHCLPHFGPFEDAMSHRSRGLFHTRVSALLNLHRLLPARVVRDVEGLDVPLASREGFVRQVLGWREFMRHVHEATDGFRKPPGGDRPKRLRIPGDGGYQRGWGEPWPKPRQEEGVDGGAAPSFLGAQAPLPPAFWGREPSGLACLDRVVADVWEEGWSHHITRLMVLSNLATLLEVDPREITDWFWVAYVDAYDWVVEPNVLGMGTFALGPLFTTKPYVSGAAYVHRMSDYCGTCAFDPKRDCPITPLYWDFLARNRTRLDGNRRMALPLRSLEKRGKEQQAKDARIARWARETLARGGRLRPEGRPGKEVERARRTIIDGTVNSDVACLRPPTRRPRR